MTINPQKTTLTSHTMEDLKIQRYSILFPFELIFLDEGLKYLGFKLKPNHYKREDWNCILAKSRKEDQRLVP